VLVPNATVCTVDKTRLAKCLIADLSWSKETRDGINVEGYGGAGLTANKVSQWYGQTRCHHSGRQFDTHGLIDPCTSC